MYKELIPCRKSEENWNRLYDNINYLYDDYWIVMANSNTYGKMPDDVKKNLEARIRDFQSLLKNYGED